MPRRVLRCLLLSSLPLLAACEFTPSTTKLAQIEQGFVNKREDYIALYDMFMEDDELTELDFGFSRMGINDYYECDGDWFDGHNNETSLSAALEDAGITKDRYDHYKLRMSHVYVPTIRKDENRVSFFKDSFGILDGWFIDIEYIPEEEFSEYVTVMQGTVVSSVDEIPTEEEGDYYLPLEGNWYLCYSMEF